MLLKYYYTCMRVYLFDTCYIIHVTIVRDVYEIIYDVVFILWFV